MFFFGWGLLTANIKKTYSSLLISTLLTLDAQVHGPAGGVAALVGRVAGVAAGLAPGHPLEHQRLGRQDDTLGQVVRHQLPLQHKQQPLHCTALPGLARRTSPAARAETISARPGSTRPGPARLGARCRTKGRLYLGARRITHTNRVSSSPQAERWGTARVGVGRGVAWRGVAWRGVAGRGGLTLFPALPPAAGRTASDCLPGER